MRRFDTIGVHQPPAAISFFMPAAFTPGYYVATNCVSGVTLTEQRIRSAFEGAEKELGRYKRYLSRWDGYQGEPFSDEVLCSATAILAYSQDEFLSAGIIPELVTTGPASDGSIDVELQVADRRVLMTLYPHPEQMTLAGFEHDEVREHVAPIGDASVAEWITWLRQPSNVPAAMADNPVRPR